MVVKVTTTGSGEFRGHETSIGSYEYSEGSMPHDVSDDSGEVGQLSFDAEDTGDSVLLYNDNVELSDNFYGVVTGKINGFSSTNGLVQVTGASRLNLINTEGVIEAQVTTITQYLRNIFSAASITTDIIVSPQIPETPIVTPAYEGSLWVLLKQFAAFHQLDVSLIGNTISVRRMRQREINIESVTSESLSLSEETFVQNFNVAYYNYVELDNVIAYPFGGWTPEVEVYSVEAGETIVFDISVNAFLDSVKQPVAQNTVPKNYSGSDSVYSVSANDGLPVSANFWENFGGRMSFKLTDLGRNIQVTLRGPDFPDLSPFSVSISDGATSYSTLRIVGSGVFFDRQTVNIPTGLTDAETPQKFGQEIDNPFIRTRNEAINAGVRARRKYCLPNQMFETSGRRLGQRRYQKFDYLVFGDPVFGFFDKNIYALVGQEDSIIFFPTFGEYDDGLPDPFPFNDFDGAYASATFGDFDSSVAEIVGQAFGTIAGSRVKFQHAYYRVRTTAMSQSEVSVAAEFDTLFDDFNKTFAIG